MKSNFTAGLAILLPIAITYMIVMFFVDLVTTPLQGLITSHLLILALICLIALLTGLLARAFLFQALLKQGSRLLAKLPTINRIYCLLYDVVHSLFSSDKPSFSQVVLVPFPNSLAYSFGFVTESPTPTDHVTVYIPGAPNPSAGYLLAFKREALIPLDMDVAKAFKFIVSGGAFK